MNSKDDSEKSVKVSVPDNQVCSFRKFRKKIPIPESNNLSFVLDGSRIPSRRDVC